MRWGLLALVVAASACKRDPAPSPAPAPSSASSAIAAKPPELVRADVETFFKPLPKSFDRPGATDVQVRLGRMLFFDERLSKNHDHSCNSCHDLAGFGVDGARFSVGHKDQLGARNAPTVYNAGEHVAQFWDGRAKDLEEQAKGPIVNPVEMAMTEARAVATVASIPEYVALFREAFPGSKRISFDDVARAIAAFERRLVTPSRFDRYLRGDETALSDVERRGLATFIKLGCPTCHNGPAVGGGSFQKIGAVNPWPDEKDLGRYVVTKNEDDKLKFRVPSLRNVAKTGPWFHDGSVARLEDVVRKMAWHQLGKELHDDEVSAIVAFLNALTGELPKDLIEKPPLPPSSSTTPKPDPT